MTAAQQLPAIHDLDSERKEFEIYRTEQKAAFSLLEKRLESTQKSEQQAQTKLAGAEVKLVGERLAARLRWQRAGDGAGSRQAGSRGSYESLRTDAAAPLHAATCSGVIPYSSAVSSETPA